jgi:hypothetical protein
MDVVVLNCWGDRDEGDVMGIEQFDQLGKVGERPGQTVDLVDHDDIDLAGSDIIQKTRQVGTVGRSSGIAAIVIA